MFSPTVIESNSAPSWNNMPKRRRTRYSSRSLARAMSTPKQLTEPLSGVSRPTMSFRVTLLPVPDGPMIAVVSPGGMSSEMPSSTVRLPNDLQTFFSEITQPPPYSISEMK